MGACTKFSKFMLFLLNILFWAAGGAMLGLGIYFRVNNDANAIVEIAGVTFYYAGCYLMISIGSIMFVMGFLGCCGAIKENKCMLGLYVIFLIVIIILQLVVGIWGFVNRDSIEQDIKNSLSNSVPLTYNADDATVQSVITLQNSFKCCGLVKGCSDWTGAATHGCSCDSDSTTCVRPVTLGCTNADSGGGKIYSEDCYDAMYNAIMSNIGLVAGLAIGVAVMEIFGIIFAIVICRDRKKNYDSY